MRTKLIRLLAGAVFALPLANARAITCYVVYDRNDNAIFQDTYPPIDLSERGQAERNAMYKRGEQLVVMESDRCPTIQFLTGSGGNTALSVDEVVAGMKTAPIPTGSARAAGTSRGATSAPRAAPPAKATSRPY
jgi:hypothetical protein